MKKLVLSLMAVCVSLLVSAQSGVTTTWPYLYGDFTPGTIYTTAGPQEPALMNIHMVKGAIHYIDKQNNVREANTKNFVKAEIAGADFMIRDGILMKVLSSRENGFVGASYLVDMASINETGGAYGVSSSTLSTQKLSSVQGNSVNMNHMELMSQKEEGQEVDVKATMYIVYGTKCIEASKKAVTEAVPAEKQADFKAFMKKNKINWKNISDIEKVIDFLSE